MCFHTWTADALHEPAAFLAEALLLIGLGAGKNNPSRATTLPSKKTSPFQPMTAGRRWTSAVIWRRPESEKDRRIEPTGDENQTRAPICIGPCRQVPRRMHQMPHRPAPRSARDRCAGSVPAAMFCILGQADHGGKE
jgi:hypothetical protein